MSEDSKIKELISRYVGGEVTPEERLIVEKVLKESSAYHAFYEAMKKLNAILNKKTTLWRTLMELQQVKNKSFLVKAMIGCASLVFLSLIVFFAYILNLEKFVSVQNTLFYTQSEFEPGAKASLMAIVLNSKDAKPIEDAEIVIALGDTRTKKEKVLYKGKTSSTGSADIQFDMPVYPQGSYDLSIKVNSRYGHDKITKSVKIKKT
ncbi:MAG: hypothetical protein H6753_06170, partial [Candidatus Omnitrophica bacterium]|nr:hypothetical protein [Candidatus Omnitrophota bacterium]